MPAIINNDLCYIKFGNVRLWGELIAKDQQTEICENTINCLKERYVSRAVDPGKDNNIIIVRKHKKSANYNYDD